ncbi:MAG: DNA polymerase III subunit gamma/tau [Clostridia bacterium]|nr:DNA polymerase III subunit gamma/tau [Clostridia bacterium]
MYLALYRKFRPKTFDNVIGQNHITNTLTNQVKTGQISHAYLFTGTRGTGKTSCAKIFAKAINCLNPQNGSPCGQCEVCRAIDEANNIDVLEIDAASNNGVNEIRELREKIKYPPIYGKYKVYIIDEVHMLTDSAFNALLKTLEEPPKHAVFILATTEVYKLPATILSRCMRFDFRLVGIELLTGLIKNIFDQLSITYDNESVEAIAVAGEGSVRDALSVADCVVAFSDKEITYAKTMEILGKSDKDVVIKLADNIISGNLGGVLETINDIYASGKNLIALGKEITVFFKDLLVIKNCNEAKKMLNVSTETFEKMKNQADRVSVEKLIQFMQKFSAIEAELKYALSPKTLIEIVSLECASLDNLKKN